MIAIAPAHLLAKLRPATQVAAVALCIGRSWAACQLTLQLAWSGPHLCRVVQQVDAESRLALSRCGQSWLGVLWLRWLHTSNASLWQAFEYAGCAYLSGAILSTVGGEAAVWLGWQLHLPLHCPRRPILLLVFAVHWLRCVL